MLKFEPIVIPPPRRARARRVPLQLQPDAIRLSYFGAIRNTVLKRMQAIVLEQVVPELPALVAAASMVHDAVKPKWRSYADTTVRIIDRAARQFLAEFTNTKLRAIARIYADRTSAFQRQQISRQFAQSIGIDIAHAEPQLIPRLKAWSTENASLIKSVPKRYFAEIESRTLNALRTGERAEVIAKDYVDRFGVSESRAMLIARDQIGKLTGQLNRARQEALGVESFVWRTVGDERVREEHEELDGKEFKWSDPPGEGIPGDPVNCRCTAEPNVEDALSALTGASEAEEAAPDESLGEAASPLSLN